MCRPRGAQFHNAAYPALKGGAIIFRASGARFSDFLPPLPKRTIGSHTPSEALGYDMSRLRRLIFAGHPPPAKMKLSSTQTLKRWAMMRRPAERDSGLAFLELPLEPWLPTRA